MRLLTELFDLSVRWQKQWVWLPPCKSVEVCGGIRGGENHPDVEREALQEQFMKLASADVPSLSPVEAGLLGGHTSGGELGLGLSEPDFGIGGPEGQ